MPTLSLYLCTPLKLDNQGIIIGGIAASLLGQPRLTADADALFLLSIEEVPYLLELAKAEGLQPRIEHVVEFASRSRVVLLQHKESGIDVDISLGFLPFEVEAVERGIDRQTGFLRIRLPTPEDLIILKAVAHRPQDMFDIEAVIAAQPDLDKERIAFWVKQFADVLEMPEVWTDIEDLLQRGSAKNTQQSS